MIPLLDHLAAIWLTHATTIGRGHHVHLPGRIPLAQITDLDLPAETDHPVTLVGDTGIQRPTRDTAAAEYARRPRTRVHENAGARTGWAALTAAHLARLSRRHVQCSLYESRTGDQTLGRHDDDWDSLIVHLHGEKHWTLWTHPDTEPAQVVTRPGDVLALPRGVPHDVATPGRSVHAVFALTTQPLPGRTLRAA
ncbi:JmjC domain-containing protein [Streptomyces sp. NPDC088789]|uniref:JmjC domain-containing protein n=1 Tax=Streptomyces sp. NPDC088789 TaxID=3365899 RepID=UPI0038289174